MMWKKRIDLTADTVMKAMCKSLAGNLYTCLVTAKELSRDTGLSLYMTYKALHALQEKGLIEKGSEGNPPECSYEGEYEHEGYPPRNGWGLTKAGYETDIYKAADKAADEAFRQWAEGDYESGRDQSEPE